MLLLKNSLNNNKITVKLFHYKGFIVKINKHIDKFNNKYEFNLTPIKRSTKKILFTLIDKKYCIKEFNGSVSVDHTLRNNSIKLEKEFAISFIHHVLNVMSRKLYTYKI